MFLNEGNPVILILCKKKNRNSFQHVTHLLQVIPKNLL